MATRADTPGLRQGQPVAHQLRTSREWRLVSCGARQVSASLAPRSLFPGPVAAPATLTGGLGAHG